MLFLLERLLRPAGSVSLECPSSSSLRPTPPYVPSGASAEDSFFGLTGSVSPEFVRDAPFPLLGVIPTCTSHNDHCPN